MPYRAQHTLRYDCDVEPEQALAAAVIGRAVDDALHNRDRNARRRARYFLRRGTWLVFWCDVAGVDIDTVREMFERRVAEC
ncbi:MAG: hypothetical protein ACOX8T_11065 [Bacillota bacterium]|jgi:hypothetical protein